MAKKFAVVDCPEELITEIFLLLPVKSLLCCKSVCKPWLSIISNPNFIKSQLNRAIIASRNNPTLVNIINEQQLAFLATEPDQYILDAPAALQQQQLQKRRRQLVNQALNGQDLSTCLVHFDRVVMPRIFKFTRVFSCCNGIVCLGDMSKGVVYLWNPSIRQCKKLPAPQHTLSKSRPVMLGFGYDCISDNYKVIRFVYGPRPHPIPFVQVYSTNVGYREYEAPVLKNWMGNVRTNIEPTNVCVNGVVYIDGGDELVSFDLHEEVVGLVPFPGFIQTNRRSNVLDFEGSVAMVFESGTGVDLWTLDNVSGELSWTKEFSIEYGLDDPDTDIWLSCYLGAKQFYGCKLLNGNYFVYEVLYDYEKKETRCYGLQEDYVNIYATLEDSEIPVRATLEDSTIPVHAAMKYTETLVSLEGFEQVE